MPNNIKIITIYTRADTCYQLQKILAKDYRYNIRRRFGLKKNEMSRGRIFKEKT